MNKKSYDMSAGEVTIDLPKLEHTLAVATNAAWQELNGQLEGEYRHVENAMLAKLRGDGETHYRELCHANTRAEYLLSAALHYAECLQALFHIAEANKREDVKFVKAEPEAE